MVASESLSGEPTPTLRTGIAMAEVVIADGTVTGEGVLLAQRLKQLADPGGVCLQSAAHKTVPRRLPLEYGSPGWIARCSSSSRRDSSHRSMWKNRSSSVLLRQLLVAKSRDSVASIRFR